MMPRWILVGLAVSLALSGCLEAETGRPGEANAKPTGTKAGPLPITPGRSELALPFGGDHNHHVGRTTPNFEVLAYDPLITDYFGTTAGGHSCGDTMEWEGRRLTVVHLINNDVTFVIVDVTDPMRPQKIGELAMANTQVYDVGLTPDQRFVIAATPPFGVGPGNVQPPLATFEDACTGERRVLDGPEAGLPWAPGLVVVDIQNPRNPTIVDSLMYPVTGGHSVRLAEIDGRILLLTAVTGSTGYYAVAELTEVGGRPKLVPLSFYATRESTNRAGYNNVSR